MLSNLESPRNQSESFSQLVFLFIRETDRFIDAVGQRAATIKNRSTDNTSELIDRISESRIATKEIGVALANLNRLLSDATYQNAILGIQRALNEIIWKYSAIRKYCLGLKMKGQALPARSPLNHMINQLDGEIYRAIRKITDSLELALERFYGIERAQDEHISLYDVEKELEHYEYFEPSHEATFILIESQKYHIREILNLYGVEPKTVSKKARKVVPFSDDSDEFIGIKPVVTKSDLVSEQRLIAIEQTFSKSIEEIHIRLDQIAHRESTSVKSENLQFLNNKLDTLESEFNRTVFAIQSRTEQINEMLQSVRLIQKQSDTTEFRDELNELRKLDQSRQKELRLLYNQLKQLMQVNESMQLTIDTKVNEVSKSIDPVIQQLEIQKHQQNQLATEVNSILEIVDEKFKSIETVKPQSAKEVAELLKPELDSVSKRLHENSMRLTEIHHKVLENEQKQKTFTKNINERFDNVVAMLREEMHAVSKNKVDSMLRKLIDYMKQTI